MEGYTQIKINPVNAELAEFQSVCTQFQALTSIDIYNGLNSNHYVYKWVGHSGGGGIIDQHCLFKTEAGDQLSAKFPLKELSRAL